MPKEIDLWFSAGSTYTYLTMMRIDDVEAASGVKFNLRPFYLGMIFKELNRFPFVEEPQKMAYMWRDIGRRADWYGLSPALPAPYPIREVVRANQVAHVALSEGFGRDYVKQSYRAWFEAGQPVGEEPNLSESLRAIGQDPARILAKAAETATHEALVAETGIARSLGIFGSPSFVVGGELFWGDDRLEDAVRWAGAS